MKLKKVDLNNAWDVPVAIDTEQLCLNKIAKELPNLVKELRRLNKNLEIKENE